MLRIWHCLCLLFLLININILIDESYEVIYKIVNQNESIQYLHCFNLGKINKARINLNEIKNDFNYRLNNYLRWIKKNQKEKYGETIEKILNQTKSRDYLIYQNRICFIFNNYNDFRSFYDLLRLFPIHKDYFVFNNETFSFFKLEYIRSKFNQISIQHIESPYSICSKDYSNFKCLNENIKKIQRLSRYFYRSDDNESIELNYQINQTIIDNEIKIIKQCNQIDCKINLFYPAYDKSDPLILKSFLSISKLEFYLQLIGLVVLFLNIPIYKLIIKIINSINFESLKIKILRLKFIKLKLNSLKEISNKLKLRINRIKLPKLLKRKYLKRNYLIILILLICLFSLFSGSIYNFIEERDYPSMKSISVDSIKPKLSIVICISIRWINGWNYNIHNRSLSEIENYTDNGLNSVVKDIYLQFLNKKIPTKWQLESKLISFIYSRRCFQLRIFLYEAKYQSIFSVTKLVIEFNKYIYSFSSIYILTDNELFNSNSYQHSTSYNFRKRILERSKLNKNKKCKDFNLVDDNCISKWNCIDQCINREVYKQIKNLTYSSFIDKKQFTDEEWSNLYIRPYSKNDNEIYDNISQKCKDKYSEFDPCIDIKFELQSQISSKISNKVEIDLNYEVIYNKEDEVSIFKLLLDLLNIQSILFGFNSFSFSFLILSFLKLRLIKIFKFLIYLICSIGFMFHLWLIYDEIINIQIIYSEHYELINLIQAPDLIFCFDFNHTKLNNQNYKLTYQYLDKITSDELSENKIFRSIEYLNQSNNWIKLNKKTNFKDNNLEIRIFYYLDRKCYKIIQNIEYNRNQFNKFDKIEDDDDGLILKIFFNRIYLDYTTFYFFTKTKQKIEFSKIQQLNLKYGNDHRSFKVIHEIIKRDEFELIKNPLSLLSTDDNQNDLDKLFTKLINYLDTKLNLVTFKLPINKTDLNLKKELDDNLFIQLYNQQQQQKQHNQTNSNTNHLRQHSINYLEISTYIDIIPDVDLEFNLSFYRKVIVISNKISLIKLIISLLNVLSFWFDLGILDLANYFIVIKLLSIQLYKLLIKIKNKLLSDIL